MTSAHQNSTIRGMSMSKYDRMLYILNLLRSRRNLNAAMLAQECGVTERSIYRDIAALSEVNVPIYYDRGYKFASNNFLPPLNFTVDEYLTLKTTLESSPLYKSGLAKKHIKSLRSKIEACLTPDVRRDKALTPEVTRVDIRNTFNPESLDRYSPLIERAIIDNKTLKMNYDSIESGAGVREVDPYFLVFRERAFYFVGFCHNRQDMRTFRLDRIKFLEITGRDFKPRRNISPGDYFKDSWGVYSGDPVNVEIMFNGAAARVIRSGHHHVGERITVIDEDCVRYQVTVAGIEEISRWLMGFGGEFTVIEPKQLRDEVLRRAKSLIIKNS